MFIRHSISPLGKQEGSLHDNALIPLRCGCMAFEDFTMAYKIIYLQNLECRLNMLI